MLTSWVCLFSTVRFCYKMSNSTLGSSLKRPRHYHSLNEKHSCNSLKTKAAVSSRLHLLCLCLDPWNLLKKLVQCWVLAKLTYYRSQRKGWNWATSWSALNICIRQLLRCLLLLNLFLTVRILRKEFDSYFVIWWTFGFCCYTIRSFCFTISSLTLLGSLTLWLLLSEF